jgi:hypothetical protein
MDPGILQALKENIKRYGHEDNMKEFLIMLEGLRKDICKLFGK